MIFPLFQIQHNITDIQLQYIAIWMFFFQEEELVTNALSPFIATGHGGWFRRPKVLQTAFDLILSHFLIAKITRHVAAPLSNAALPPPWEIKIQVSYEFLACIFFIPLGLRAVPDRGGSPTPVHVDAIIPIIAFVWVQLHNCAKLIFAGRIVKNCTSGNLQTFEPQTFKESLGSFFGCIRFHSYLLINTLSASNGGVLLSHFCDRIYRSYR